MLIEGNDIPKKKPSITPITVVIKSLILSFGFLKKELRPAVPSFAILSNFKLKRIDKYSNQELLDIFQEVHTCKNFSEYIQPSQKAKLNPLKRA